MVLMLVGAGVLGGGVAAGWWQGIVAGAGLLVGGAMLEDPASPGLEAALLKHCVNKNVEFAGMDKEPTWAGFAGGVVH